MKTAFTFYLIVCILILSKTIFAQTFESKDDRAQLEPDYIVLDPPQFIFPYDGGEDSLFVSSDVSWNVTIDVTWVAVDSTHGTGDDTLLVTCEANPGFTTRLGTIIVAGGDAADTTLVIQPGDVPGFLIVDPDNTTLSYSAGSFSAYVYSNTDWTINDTIPWITCDTTEGTGNDTISINYTENTNPSSRTGTLIFQSDGLEDETIQILQTGIPPDFLIVDPDNKTISSDPGSFFAYVYSNTNWTIHDTISWIECDTIGSGNDIVTLNYTENTSSISRTGVLFFQADGLPDETIYVVQTGIGQTFLIVDPDSKTVSSAAGDFSAYIQSNTNWNIDVSDPSWITCSTLAGSDNDTILVEYEENTDEVSRSATLTFTASGLPPETIYLIQTGQGQTFLVVDPDSKTVSSPAGNFSAYIQSNTDWTISLSDPWITCSTLNGSDNDTIVVNYEENTTPESRSGNLTVNAAGLPPETIYILQTGQGQTFLVVDPDSKTVSSSAGNFTASIQTNANWDINDTIPWITCNPENGGPSIQSTTISFELNPNETSRSGTLLFQSDGDTYDTIFILQTGQGQTFLIVDPDSKTVSSNAGGFIAEVQSNTSWTIGDTIPWVYCNPEQGSNSQTVTITYDENPNQISRSGTLTFQADGLEDELIEIVQYGTGQTFLVVDPDSKYISSSVNNFEATLQSNTDWTIENNNAWITCSPDQGSNNAIIDITCQANSSPNSRSGTLLFMADGLENDTLLVIQEGTGQTYLIVDPDNQLVLANGGNHAGYVKSNLDWEAEESNSWIILSTTTGSGNGSITYSCLTNPGANSRTGSITITPLGSSGVDPEIINIVQFGQEEKFLIVDPDSPTVLAEGGDFVATVFSNVSWNASSSYDWITIDTSFNRDISTFQVICDENLGSASRTGTVVVTGSGIPNPEIITITQYGQSENFLHVNNLYPNVAYTAGEIEFSVTSNMTWQVSKDVSWITDIIPTSGTGSQDFTVYYTENPLGPERQAIIQVASDELIVNITLTQDGTGATVSLTGKVVDGSNNGIPEVTISFISSSGVKQVETLENGDYSLSLALGRTGNLRPDKEGWIFYPSVLTFDDPIVVDQQNLDFTGGLIQSLNVYFEQDSLMLCKGDSRTLYPIISGATSAASYSWTSNPPGFVLDDEINPIVSPSTNTYYILSIYDINATAKDSILVLANDLPEAKSISGITQVCQNQAGLSYNVIAPSNNETYSWKLLNGGTIIHGEDNISSVINWGDSPGIYTLSLITTNIYGCTSASEIYVEITEQIAPLPADIQILETDVSCILISMDTTADYYRWGYTIPNTQEEFILEGQTERFCEVSELCGSMNNVYWVETSYATNSCVSRTYYNYTYPVGITEPSVETRLEVYPNPAKDLVHVSLDNNYVGNVDLRICNSTGVMVYSSRLKKHTGKFTTTVYLPGLHPGLYIINIGFSNQQVSKKLIISH